MLFKEADLGTLQTYINQLQAAKLASKGVFDATTISTYATAIEGLEAKQAALLLSTQGLNTAQIQQTLTAKGLTVEEQYQAMVEAGLLARKQKLTVAQVQENLQTVLGAEADTSAAMASLGLSASIEGQEHQTVQLTAKKLQEAVATHALTEAQAQELAMRTGVTFAMQKQAVSTLPKWIATVQAATKAVWSQVKATAAWLTTNPAGWATIAVTAIGGVIFGLSKLSEAEKRASEKADELYEKSSTLVQQNKEEIKSLDELISKYKELKEKGSLDLEDRNEIKEIQNDIADLVGTQVKNLDLVNGRLDDQIKKLDEISEKEAKRAYQNAQANYYNAKDAADKAAPADARIFFIDYDYAGKIEAEARKALEEAGFGYYNSNGKLASPVYDGGFGLDGIMGSRMVVKAAGETAQEKYDYLQKMISTLEQYGQSNTEIYKGLMQQTGEYEKYINQQQSSIESLMDSWAVASQYTSPKLSEITVDSIDTFEQYRQTMISEAKNEESIGEALADGILSNEDIEKSVNDFMATAEGFAEWYAKWQESMKGTDVSIDISFSDQLTKSEESLDKFQSSVKSASEAYTTLLSGNYSSSELLDSIQAINEAVTDMKGSINWEEIDSLDLLGDKLEDISKSYAESILSVAGINVGSDFGQILTNIIQQMYEVEAQFTGMNSQLDNLQSSYKTLTDVLESYNETGYISLDNLQSLLTADENLIAMLEVENGKLTINQEAYENLVAVQLQEFKEKLNNAAAAEIEALALNKAEEATNNNAKASEDAVAKLDAETEAFKRNTEAVSENALTKAMTQAEEVGVSKEEIQGVLDKYTKIWNAAMDNYSKDFPTFMDGAKSSASSAGEDAGKAFTEALDKELNALDTKMEAGYIDP